MTKVVKDISVDGFVVPFEFRAEGPIRLDFCSSVDQILVKRNFVF